jgi:YVTN family beta-propeller protein
MALSPDGTRLLVSASTANKVHVIDPIAGKLVGEFPSGDSPHESNFSRDGRLIYHASIGLVYTPLDQPALDTTKGERIFEIVDAKTLQVVRRFDIGKVLEANGYPGYSSAIRPMAIAPDERHFYFQLSFLHGFVEFDMQTGKPLRIANLPVSDATRKLSREEYLLDSAHHGLAINGAGTKLCVAGTMSDYAAIVDRATFSFKRFDIGRKPYWATDSADGKRCWVSFSGDDKVEVLDYAAEKVVASIPVGDHPQRVRSGVIANELVPGLPPAVGVAPSLSRRCVARGRVRTEVRAPDGLVRRVEFRSGGRRIAVDRRAPFRLTRSRAGLRGRKVTAIVLRGDGGRRVITRALPRCATNGR